MKRLLFVSLVMMLFLMLSADAKTVKPQRYDGLSGRPSSQKPSKTVLCGSNNAWAMSEQTEASIYGNLGKAAGLKEAEVRTLRVGDELVQSKLSALFGNNAAVCKVTLLPNGRIKDAVMKKSSGSADTDKKILDFVKSAGPFSSNEFPEALSWAIEFPGFKVLPDWFDEPSESSPTKSSK